MNKLLAFVSFFLVFGLIHSAIPNQHKQVKQWDRSSAMAAARSVNIDVAVYEIGDISSLRDGKTTLSKLKNMETRSDWPLPAREAVIYQFTLSLADLPREAVAVEIMQYLQNFQPQTLVPHEEHRDAAIPLFNIRRAATGIENGWQRTEFAIEAETLLATQADVLLSTYVKSENHNQRSAYLDALRQADTPAVIQVQDLALEQLAKTPSLTPMLGITAARTADTFAIKQLLSKGRGAGLSTALELIGKQLQAPETAELLVFAIQQAPATNATLAIAAWWPQLSHDAATRDLLVGLLSDPALGSSAALALAKEPDIQTIKALLDTADGDSIAARRARLALDINRDRLVGEGQP
jgi:hypothetical protein